MMSFRNRYWARLCGSHNRSGSIHLSRTSKPISVSPIVNSRISLPQNCPLHPCATRQYQCPNAHASGRKRPSQTERLGRLRITGARRHLDTPRAGIEGAPGRGPKALVSFLALQGEFPPPSAPPGGLVRHDEDDVRVSKATAHATQEGSDFAIKVGA